MQLFSPDTSISLRLIFFAHENMNAKNWKSISMEIGLRHPLLYLSTCGFYLQWMIITQENLKKMYMVEEFSKLTKLISK